ncbi:hypothetical protein [Pseudonocardia xishanensis]|uniref:Lipoprotein LpqN n=1 Tax=Pseudonocardia xishanensis TaxID=630995 RepID=A0ABP8S2Q1_9PSEU
MNRSLLTLLPAVAAAALLTGCGAVADAPPRVDPVPVAQAAPITPPAPVAPVAPVAAAPVSAPAAKQAAQPAAAVQRPAASSGDQGLDAAADGLRPFLLTPAEVGPAFTVGDEPKPDPATPAICGGPGVVARFPYAVRVGAAAESPAGLVQETVSVYGDAGSAAAAYRASVAGMACSQGSVGGKPAVLAPAEDLSVDLPYDEATGWRVGGEGFDVVLISLRDDAVVMNFTVLAPEDGLVALPDPLTIAQAGAQKLLG